MNSYAVFAAWSYASYHHFMENIAEKAEEIAYLKVPLFSIRKKTIHYDEHVNVFM